MPHRKFPPLPPAEPERPDVPARRAAGGRMVDRQIGMMVLVVLALLGAGFYGWL